MTVEIIQEITNSIMKLIFVPICIYAITEVIKTYFRRQNIKEEKYINLLESLSSLYEGNQQDIGNKEKKQEFLKQFRHCWIYAPDKVISTGEEFLKSISEEKSSMSKEDIDSYLKEKQDAFLLSIRKDMVKTTKIKEFGNYSAQK
jgi:hypothetical protein